MIDFDALVQGPVQTAFGRPVMVTPLAATSPVAPFPATGVWSVRPVDIALDNNESLNTTTITLGIRLSAWTVAPRQGMQVRVPAAGFYPDEGTLWIDDVDLDGLGGARLTLKRKPPSQKPQGA